MEEGLFILTGPTLTKDRVAFTGEKIGDMDIDEGVYALGISVCTNDDFIKDKYGVYYGNGSDSYQIRPNALYRNSKGTYFKDGNYKAYLSEEQERELEKFVEYLKEVEWDSEDLRKKWR